MGKDTVTKPLKALTIKEKVFIDFYTNKDNKQTYLNGVQSALRVYTDNYKSAGAMASQKLKEPRIINYLESELDKQGMNTKVRLGILADLARGGARKSITRQYAKSYNAEGEAIGTPRLTSKMEVITPVRDSDRIAAVKEMNAMTGLYKQQDIDKSQALREIEDMYDKIVGVRKSKQGDTGEPG